MAAPSQKVDLHVHTPASADYAGERGEGGYVSLLRECKHEGVSAIAITDHNTVNGCIAIDRLKRDTRLNFELNSKRGGIKDFLDQLKEEMLLFESISIINAVEVSVYPKVHLILCFSEIIDLATVQEFLRSDLNFGEAVDNGSPETYCRRTPTDVLDVASSRFGENYFCILPHIDSTNGAWRELSGLPRAELFTKPQVLAVQVLSPDTKKHLIDNVFRSEEYARKPPLGIIQASDYHGGAADQLARQYSELDYAGNITFFTLLKYFKEGKPIKLSSDFMDESYKFITEGKEVIAFDFKNGLSVDEHLELILAKALCGCVNSTGAIMQFNIFNSTLSPQEESENLRKLISERLRPRIDPPLRLRYRIMDFSYSPSRQRHLVEQLDNNRLRMVKGEVLTIQNRQVVTATSADVEQMVSRNLYRRFGKRKQTSLSKTADKLLMIADSMPALTTAYRIDQLIDRGLLNDLEKDFVTSEYSTALERVIEGNGVPCGDFYFLKRSDDLKAGRLENHYLRFTTPAYLKRDVELPSEETVTVPTDAVIVYPEGGVHYTEQEGPIFAPFPILIIRPKKDHPLPTGRPLLGLAAFLKSSFLVWYMMTIHETLDVFEFIFRRMPMLPLPADQDLLPKLVVHSERVIIAEKKLLKEFARDKWDRSQQRDAVEKHNREANNNLRLIDRDVLLALQFRRQEVEEIYRALSDLKICDYGAQSCGNEFFDQFPA